MHFQTEAALQLAGSMKSWLDQQPSSTQGPQPVQALWQVQTYVSTGHFDHFRLCNCHSARASSANSFLHLSSPSHRLWMPSRLLCSAAKAPAAAYIARSIGVRHCQSNMIVTWILLPNTRGQPKAASHSAARSVLSVDCRKPASLLRLLSCCVATTPTCEQLHELCIGLGK